VLTLRLYQPSAALAAQPLALRPPQLLRRGDCP